MGIIAPNRENGSAGHGDLVIGSWPRHMAAEEQQRAASTWDGGVHAGGWVCRTFMTPPSRRECQLSPPSACHTCVQDSNAGYASVRAAGSENRVRNQNDEAGWQVCTRTLDQHVHRTASGPGWWRVRARAEAKGAPKALLTQYGQTIG